MILPRRLLVFTSLIAALAASAAAQVPAPRVGPSGFPVPRYVALKFNEVNARGGPGDDYRLLWTYRARGLPVQVVAETRDWRRVCDPQGGVAWVKATGTDGRQKVMRLQRGPLPLRGRPDPAAPVKALMAERALADLDRCKRGWCRISLGGMSGWTPQTALWGTDDRPQCR